MEMVGVVIPAAGSGKRMGGTGNKTLLDLRGIPVLIWSVKKFAALDFITHIVVVVKKTEVSQIREILAEYGLSRDVQVVVGGNERQESVYNGLCSLPLDTRWVFIHDAARPLVDEDILQASFTAVKKHEAVGVGVPVKDTIKRVDENQCIIDTPDRSMLWAIQTPQVFSMPLIRQAHEQARAENWQGTDDCSLVERLGISVQMITGSYGNLKITTPEDRLVAEVLLNPSRQEEHTMVGFGYDVHQLVSERDLVLCGVKIPYDRGLAGHSDADVATHALMDALLGAAGLGDIGQHFPDTDDTYRGISSLALLRDVMVLLEGANKRLVNIDITIAAQQPKLAPYIQEMRDILSGVLGLEQQFVNIKATTTEHLGFVGNGKGIAAYAVASIY